MQKLKFIIFQCLSEVHVLHYGQVILREQDKFFFILSNDCSVTAIYIHNYVSTHRHRTGIDTHPNNLVLVQLDQVGIL